MKLKILLPIIFYLLLPLLISGQIAEEIDRINADSLMEVLPSLVGRDRIDALNQVAFDLSRDKPDTAISISFETKKNAESINYLKGIADAHLSLGLTYLFLDSLKTSVTHLLNAQQLYEMVDTCIGMGLVYYQLMRINHMTGRYEKSKVYGRKTFNVYEKLGLHKYKVIPLQSIGFSCTLNKEYDSANYYYKQCLAIIDTHDMPYFKPGIYVNMGFNLQWENYLLDSIINDRQYIIKLFRKASDLSKKYHDSILFALSLNNQILEYQQMGTEEGNRKWKETALRVIDYGETRKIWPQILTEAYRRLGEYEYHEGNITNAISLVEKAISRGKSSMNEWSLQDFQNPFTRAHCKHWLNIDLSYCYGDLCLYYRELGDFEHALENYTLKQEIDEKIAQQENKDLVAILETDYENEKTRSEFALLEGEKELSELRTVQFRNTIVGLLVLLAIILFFGIFFIRLRKIRMQQKSLMVEQQLKHDLQIKKVESDKLKELDSMKSRFFANISHEFRTPLTLILGPLEELRSYLKEEKPERDLDMIQRNARRLQNLINQLLSLSKLESGKMKLKVKEEDIVSLSKGYVQSFDSLAKQKNINLEFKSGAECIPIYLDRDKYEKILYNLISNAFKFTGKGGRIQVLVVGIRKMAKIADSKIANREDQWVEIKVSDTGRGIPPEKLPHIFDRFYQVNDSENNYQEGTGIGLALTKELVELHRGKISVKSEEGRGSEFIVELPLGVEHLAPEEKSEKRELKSEIDYKLEPTTNNQQPTTNIISDNDPVKPLLLIVEDNADMRHYIRSNISADFFMTEAADGEQGYKKAIEKVPDLIISDVMMPKMDGMELCGKLKTDERTSHIPVILLTAKASMEDRLEGLETGADDFLTKPFDVQELLVRINNLILQRKRLQEKFMQNAKQLGLSQVLNLPESGFNSTDQKFLNKAVEIINSRMDDEEFSVEVFSKEMALGRTQLHKKFKSLLGQSPSVFIRTLRLNRAAELLKANKGSISEIAFEVGFNNLSYFSKCFQEQFGVLPSEFSK